MCLGGALGVGHPVHHDRRGTGKTTASGQGRACGTRRTQTVSSRHCTTGNKTGRTSEHTSDSLTPPRLCFCPRHLHRQAARELQRQRANGDREEENQAGIVVEEEDAATPDPTHATNATNATNTSGNKRKRSGSGDTRWVCRSQFHRGASARLAVAALRSGAAKTQVKALVAALCASATDVERAREQGVKVRSDVVKGLVRIVGRAGGGGEGGRGGGGGERGGKSLETPACVFSFSLDQFRPVLIVDPPFIDTQCFFILRHLYQ